MSELDTLNSPNTASQQMRVLLQITYCNPEIPSLPIEAYQYYRAIRERAEVTLVTAIGNRPALEAHGHAADNIVYIPESRLATWYFRLFISRVFKSGRNWPLVSLLLYPIYAEFNQRVYRRMQHEVRAGRFDIVHAFTPITPRHPYRLSDACEQTPFILGPLNGGLDYPEGFRYISRREGGYLRLLRHAPHLLPGYRRTYRQAARILAGSDHILGTLRNQFPAQAERIDLFYENGITEAFIGPGRTWAGEQLNILFVGRLVPLKGVDMLIDALAGLSDSQRQRISVTIVGDGPERQALEAQSAASGLSAQVRFAGEVPHRDILPYYQQADLFCFPSIREMGGIVVLEAMGTGLPSIVIDAGGPASYVTDEVGFRIAPTSRTHVVQEISRIMTEFLDGHYDYQHLSAQAVERARQFEWGVKGDDLIALYTNVLAPGH